MREIFLSRAGARKSDLNPIYILAAIALGVPVLVMIPLIGLNPGVQEGTFSSIAVLVVLSAFIVAAIFEIKRLADQPSGTDHV